MRYVMTIGGQGTRLKTISPVDKHLLYYKNKRLVEWIKTIIPTIEIIGVEKTNSRKETLNKIAGYEDVVIIDCDIIPFGIEHMLFTKDTIVCFWSHKKKYGSVIVEDSKVIEADEKDSISYIKCSGVYFVESVDKLLEKMEDENSIAKAMIGSSVIVESSFVRMGDIEDYMEAL